MDKTSIFQIMNDNIRILNGIAEYLNNDPRAITSHKVKNLAKECFISEEEAYIAYFSAIIGLDTDKQKDKLLEKKYIRKGLTKLDISLFQNNPYYKNISFPNVKKETWEMKKEQYFPYEPFAAGHPIYTKDYLEIPKIGYFEKIFSYPSILENGVQWMTVTPNEIFTMEEPIQHAHGKVMTLGLGLGYFTYMVDLKEDVKEIIVIERDKRVIDLFQEYILPQFPYKEKIKIVNEDAFQYLKEHLQEEIPDVLFADLWHDPSDGIDLYIKLLSYEKLSPKTKYDYWIEPSILQTIRHVYFGNNLVNSGNYIDETQLNSIMDNAYLKNTVRTLNSN